MYGLDQTIDLSFLKSREVIQVAIGVWDFILNFDEEVSICVTSKWELISESHTFTWVSGAPKSASPSLNLLAATVDVVKGSPDGTLELRFSNGDVLFIYDDSKQFESYTITRPGETIVV